MLMTEHPAFLRTEDLVTARATFEAEYDQQLSSGMREGCGGDWGGASGMRKGCGGDWGGASGMRKGGGGDWGEPVV